MKTGPAERTGKKRLFPYVIKILIGAGFVNGGASAADLYWRTRRARRGRRARREKEGEPPKKTKGKNEERFDRGDDA
jgi:hypothetical protein